MLNIYLFLFMLYFTHIFKNMTEEIICFKHGYNEIFSAHNPNKREYCSNGKCMEKFCLDKKAKSPQCKHRKFGQLPCIARRRGCDDGEEEVDDKCGDGENKEDYYYMKDMRWTCNKTDKCNRAQYTEWIDCLKTVIHPDTCRDGCITSFCKEGKKQKEMYQGCYEYKVCSCGSDDCDEECTDVHTCSLPCFDKHCNTDPPPTTTTTTSTTTTTTTTKNTIITSKTTINSTAKTTTTNDTIIAVDRNGLRIINGWVHGKAKPFGLTEMQADNCGSETRKNQISLDVAMKICVAKDTNCTGGLTLCYQSRMSGIQNPNASKDVANSRTAPFRLANVEGPIWEICNNRKGEDDELWADWVKLENHGITLSSSTDGKSVEIRTSYDHEQRIFEAKLNANGCAVFHFNRNKTTGVEDTIWNLKSPEDTDDDDDEEEGKTSSVATSSPSPLITTLTDKTTVWTSNNSSSNVTVPTEQQKTEEDQEQTETTTADAEQTPTEGNPDTEEPVVVDWRENFDAHFWAKLRSGVPLHSFEPLMTLPLDVLTGVAPDQEKLFTVVQDQKEGDCRMRVTFHPDCLDKECLATTNLDGTGGTDSDESSTDTGG